MSVVIEGKVEGLERTLLNIALLKGSKVRSLSRRALQTASSTPLKRAKQLAPKETGQLRKSLGKKSKNYDSASVVIIGPRVGFMNAATGRNPVRYAHLVELGTKRAKPKPFILPALKQSSSQSVSIYSQRISSLLEVEVAKMRLV